MKIIQLPEMIIISLIIKARLEPDRQNSENGKTYFGPVVLFILHFDESHNTRKSAGRMVSLI